MAAKKSESESSPTKRRQSLNADVEKFLAAGNKIEYIPDGVSAQDPQGRGKPLSSNTSQKTAPTAIGPAVDAKAVDAKSDDAQVEDTKVEDNSADVKKDATS